MCDRVVSNGPHAKCVEDREMLAALILEEVGDEAVRLTVVKAIGLPGIRRIQPTPGAFSSLQELEKGDSRVDEAN